MQIFPEDLFYREVSYWAFPDRARVLVRGICGPAYQPKGEVSCPFTNSSARVAKRSLSSCASQVTGMATSPVLPAEEEMPRNYYRHFHASLQVPTRAWGTARPPLHVPPLVLTVAAFLEPDFLQPGAASGIKLLLGGLIGAERRTKKGE